MNYHIHLEASSRDINDTMVDLKECEMVIADFMEDTSYIDVEEINELVEDG